MMNEECPNCKQITNTSCSRLVKDSCGHTKCRMCLLYEERGCKICSNERRVQSIQNYGKTIHLCVFNLSSIDLYPINLLS